MDAQQLPLNRYSVAVAVVDLGAGHKAVTLGAGHECGAVRSCRGALGRKCPVGRDPPQRRMRAAGPLLACQPAAAFRVRDDPTSDGPR